MIQIAKQKAIILMSPYFMIGLRKKLDWWTQILHGLVAQVERVEAMMELETVK